MHWNLQIKNHTKLNTFILMYLCFNHILRIHTDIVSTITSKCKMNCLFEHKQCSPVFCLFEYNDGVFIVWGFSSLAQTSWISDRIRKNRGKRE